MARGAKAERWTLLLIFERAQKLALVKLEAATVQRVRTGLGDVVHNRACIAAVLRTEIIGDDLYFLNGVLVTEKDLRSAYAIVVVRLAVDFRVVVAATLPIDGVIVTIGVGKVITVGADHAGDEFSDGVETIVQRQILDLFRTERGGHLGIGGLQQSRCRAVHFDMCGGRWQCQLDLVQTGGRARIHLNSIHGCIGKSRCGNAEGVLADRQRIERKSAIRSGSDLALRPLIIVSRGNLRPGDSSAAGIDDGTINCPSSDALAKATDGRTRNPAEATNVDATIDSSGTPRNLLNSSNLSPFGEGSQVERTYMAAVRYQPR